MLTIGEFSRLSRISARMLRHYDAMGLLRPEAIGENGYRYYRQEQLAALLRIRRLNGYGFPLSEVGELLALSDGELLPRLQERAEALREELVRLEGQLSRMEADILRMEGKTMSQNKYHVILMEDPAQKVFSIRKTVGVDQFHALFQELREEAAKRGLKQAGPIQMLYHDPEFCHERSDVEAQMVVAQDAPGVTEKPAFICAAVTHKGPYDGLHNAYDALCAWMAEHPEYKMRGPAMDRYFNDPHSVSSPEELATGVLFPVEPA